MTHQSCMVIAIPYTYSEKCVPFSRIVAVSQDDRKRRRASALPSRMTWATIVEHWPGSGDEDGPSSGGQFVATALAWFAAFHSQGSRVWSSLILV